MLDIIDHGTIREIKLNRPPANAINPALAEALGEAFEAAGNQVEALVISGQPGMFSAGLDIPELINLDHAGMSEFWNLFQRNLKAIACMPIPTVFAMTGHSPAGGMVMGIFGDYRIMPRGGPRSPYKTGLNEVRVGLVAPYPAQRALARIVGEHVAERILVAGEMMTAERALEIGLVDELADDPEAVVSRALEWCEEHLALPRQAMLETRFMTRAGLRGFIEKATYQDAELFVAKWFEDQTQATLRAMVERLKK